MKPTPRALNVWESHGEDVIQVKNPDGSLSYRVAADGTVYSVQQDMQAEAFAALQAEIETISLSGLPPFIDGGTF